MEAYDSKPAQKVHRGWIQYFKEVGSEKAPKVIRDLHTLTIYITYLQELNSYLLQQKEPIWHTPSAIVSFAVGIAVGIGACLIFG